MTGELILCHDCDLPTRLPAGPDGVPPGGSARCARCGALLHRPVPDSFDRTLAFALGGVVLFAVANAFPFLSMVMQGNVTETTLLTGVKALYEEERVLIAGLVLLTTFAAPLLHLTAMLYVLLPLRVRGRPAPAARPVFRLLHRVETWSMMEVFMIGILVSLTKLADMAQIVPGIALWAFAALIPVVVAATSSLDSRLVWERIGDRV